MKKFYLMMVALMAMFVVSCSNKQEAEEVVDSTLTETEEVVDTVLTEVADTVVAAAEAELQK